ncbi:MAG: protein O-mannosyl-transferase [Verrucomicrobiota bacterium]
MNRANQWPRTLLICVLLGAATLAIYWPVVHYQFINFDDLGYIIQNPHVRSGFSGDNVGWAFTTGYGSNWHPLTWLSHMLDGQLFGLNAGGHHLVNLLFHTANTVLLFLVLRRMTGATWRSAFVAALFALHPLHVESVAWVAERKDVLSTFFFFLTLLAYEKYVSKNKSEIRDRTTQETDTMVSIPKSEGSPNVENPKAEIRRPKAEVQGFPIRNRDSMFWYCSALFLFALGLLSKPMLVTLPFVLLLLDYWPLGRWERKSTVQSPQSKVQDEQPDVHGSMSGWPVRLGPLSFVIRHSSFLIWEKLPFFALSLASSIITFLVQEHGGAVADLNIMPVSLRVSNALVSYVSYLKKMVWPVDLALLYPPRGAIPVWMIGGSLLLLVIISLLALAMVRRAPYLAVGWFWYLGTLVPVIGLVQVGMQSMADRYTYVPLIGLFIAITWGVADGVEAQGSRLKAKVEGKKGKEGHQGASPQPGHPEGMDITQPRVASSELPWDKRPTAPYPERVVSGRPRGDRVALAVLALIVLGLCVSLTATQVRFWKNTETISVHSLAVTSDNPLMQNNLGTALLEEHRFEESAEHFRAALRIQPNYAEAESNLGFSQALQGKLDDAIEHYHRALELKPTIVRTHYVLGQALSAQGKRDEAIAEFRITLELNPDWPPALNDLAWFRAADPRPEVRDGAEAVELAERACRLTEYRDPLMIGTLAAAYAEAGRFDDAIKTGEKAQALATATGKPALAERNRELLKLYREHKPFHEEDSSKR